MFRPRKLYLFAALIVGLSIGLTYFVLMQFELELSDHEQLRLSNLTQLQVKRLNQFVAANHIALRSLIRRGDLRAQLELWNQLQSDAVAAKMEIIASDIDQSVGSFDGVAIFDQKQRVLVSTRDSVAGNINFDLHDHNDYELLPQVFAKEIDHHCQLFMQQHVQVDGADTGYVLTQLNLKPLRKILEDKTGLGDTGEVLFAVQTEDSEILFMFNPANASHELLKTFSKSPDLKSALHIAKQSEINFFTELTDQHGHEVLATLQPLPFANAFIILKVDKEEAFASVYKLRRLALGINSMIILMALLVLLINLRYLSVPLNRLKSAIRNVSLGQQINPIDLKKDEDVVGLITAFNHMNLQIQQREYEIKTVVENSLEAIVTLNEEGQITAFNSTAENLFGYSRDEVLGKSMAEHIVPERYRQRHYDGMKRFLAGEGSSMLNRRVELSALNKQGDEIPIELMIIAYQIDQRWCFNAYIRDLRDQKAAQRLSHKFASIVASSNDAIIAKDLDGTVQSWNFAAEKMYLYKSAEVVGKNIDRIVPDDKMDELENIMQGIKRGESIPPFQTTRVRKDGKRIEVQITISPYRDSEGKLIGAAAIARDLSALMQLEARIIQAQKEQLRLKDDILSHVSHELRTPLAAIHQYVSIVTDEIAGTLADKQKEYLGVAQRNIARLERMISDLMDVARSRSGKLSLDAENETAEAVFSDIREQLQTLSKTNQIKLSIDVTKDLPSIYADKRRIQQVIDNLVNNAMKHVKEVAEPKISLAVSPYKMDSRFVLFAVQDNGPGIPQEHLDKIFNRLYQPIGAPSSRKGLGLGLTICKDIIDLHGGQIWVESEPNEQTTFYFTIPRFDASTIIETHLMKRPVQGKEISVVQIQVSIPEKLLSSFNLKQAWHEFCSTLQGAIMPDRDLILKSSDPLQSVEMIYLLIRADKSGTQAVMERLDDLLQETRAVQMHGFEFMIESKGTVIQAKESGSLSIEILGEKVMKTVDLDTFQN